MTYQIDWQSLNAEGITGKAPITLNPKTADSTSTSITLTGKGLLNYGEIQQENFIRLMENFASATAPLHATVGQLWYDTSLTQRVPKIYDVNGNWLPIIIGDLNGFITLAGDPSQPLHPVTKQYLDSIVSGLLPQSPAVAATTGPITLATLQTIDGVAIVAGDRVLVKDQADQKTNGIYVAATGLWTRATDFDGSPAGEVVSGMSYGIASGTLNGGARFALSTANPVVIGTSNIVFNLVVDYTAYTNVGNHFSAAQNFDAGFMATGASSVVGVLTTNGLVSNGITYTNGTLVQSAMVLGAGSGSRVIDLSQADVFSLTVNASPAPATTFLFQNPQPTGRVHVFLLEVTDGGSNTVTWPASVVWTAGTPPTLKTSGVDLIALTTRDGGVTYYGALVAGGGTGGTYTLPIASAGTLGGVKVGSGLSIDGAGVLSAAAASTNNLTLTGTTTISGRLVETANNRGTITGAQTIDLTLGNVVSATIGGNTTFTFTNPAAAGSVSAFVVELTNGGASTITWPGAVSWVAGSAPTLRASGKNVLGFFTRDGGASYQAFLIA